MAYRDYEEDESEEEGIELPEWTPRLFGYVYKIYQLDDDSVEVSNLPEWLELTFDFDNEIWTMSADVPDLFTASWEDTDLDELFETVAEALAPLRALFVDK